MFYQLPNSNLFTHRMLFSSEKPLVKSTAPESILYHICFEIYFYLFLFSGLLFQKPKNTLLHFFIIYFILQFIEIYLSKIIQTNLSFTQEGLTTPLTRRVGSICSLCAFTVYIVLLGPPTWLIPWFHNWGKYLSYLCCIILSSLGKYRRSSSDIIIQPITVQQAYEGITRSWQWASWNWWRRKVDDDDGDGFPSPEPSRERLGLGGGPVS